MSPAKEGEELRRRRELAAPLRAPGRSSFGVRP